MFFESGIFFCEEACKIPRKKRKINLIEILSFHFLQSKNNAPPFLIKYYKTHSKRAFPKIINEMYIPWLKFHINYLLASKYKILD